MKLANVAVVLCVLAAAMFAPSAAAAAEAQ